MIGGNVEGKIQICTTAKNSIGEGIQTWIDKNTLIGWLDYSSGDSDYQRFNSKMQESTHVFICDYSPLDPAVRAENSRMIVDGNVYDILLIDNPMGLNRQWEIILKFIGGGSNG